MPSSGIGAVERDRGPDGRQLAAELAHRRAEVHAILDAHLRGPLADVVVGVLAERRLDLVDVERQRPAGSDEAGQRVHGGARVGRVVHDLVGGDEVEPLARQRRAQQVGLDVVQVLGGAELALGGDDALAEVEGDDGGVGQARETRGVAAEAGACLQHRALAVQEPAQAFLVVEAEALDVPPVLHLDALPDLLLVNPRPLGRERVERARLVAVRTRLRRDEPRDAVANREAMPIGAGELALVHVLLAGAVEAQPAGVVRAHEEVERGALHSVEMG